MIKWKMDDDDWFRFIVDDRSVVICGNAEGLATLAQMLDNVITYGGYSTVVTGGGSDGVEVIRVEIEDSCES